MKALIMTLGTRGDVQPFVALARALDAAGHETVLCAPHRFGEFVTASGVTFAGVDDGPIRLLDSPAEAGEAFGGGVRARLRQIREMPSMFDQVLTDSWQVAAQGAGAGADVVIHNGARGVAPEPLSQRKLTGPLLADRIDEACAPATVAAASELGVRVAGERGLDHAVALIERAVEADQ